MSSKYDYDIISDYLHGLTDKKTSLEISELIKTDEVARTIAEGIVRLNKEFKDDDVSHESYFADFRKKQLEVISQHAKPKREIVNFSLRIAAALLLLIAAGAVIRILVSEPDYQQIVDKELSQPYSASTVVRSESDESSKEKAFQLYTQGEFAKASAYFELATADDKENASIVFYHALSQIYVEHYEEAITLLKADVIPGSRYAQQAEWFQALALLKSGNKGEAKEVLTNIRKNSQHYKLSEAQELLNALD
jgi:hypothetical protein